MRNYFILDGVDSRDFGVYISGQGTFNAPSREYNLLPVPGRNGDLVGPEKRFANGVLTYPAFIYTNFDANIEAFRNFLLSLVGYHDLVDSYHPDEIRKVLFQGPFEPQVTTRNDAGSFDISFICKPQRFLASGNEVTTFESTETETFSGSIVTFDNPGGATVSALSTAINPVQDLHGYDNPWPAGGGKNKYPIMVGNDVWVNNGSATHSTGADGSLIINTSSSSSFSGVYLNTASATMTSVLTAFGSDARTISMDVVASASGTVRLTSGNTQTWTIGTTKQRISIVSTAIGCSIYGVNNGATLTVSNVQVEAGSTDTDFAPYENICPISGFSAANIVVSPTLDAQDGTTYTVSFGAAGTVYGGTLTINEDGSGQVVADKTAQVITGNDLNLAQNIQPEGNLWRLTLATSRPHTTSTYSDALCNSYKVVRSYSAVNNTNGSVGLNSDTMVQILVRNDSFTTRQEIIDGLNASPIQLVYELAAPLTYTLTPTEVALLTGTNNVWSNTGDITATIAFPQAQFTITNPTLFDSQPFLRVWGTGQLGIGSQTVTITQTDVYTDIDCEMMDAFKGTANKNPYVQLTDHNFPVFKPGVNNISLGTGITKVEITPRWWIA